MKNVSFFIIINYINLKLNIIFMKFNSIGKHVPEGVTEADLTANTLGQLVERLCLIWGNFIVRPAKFLTVMMISG